MALSLRWHIWQIGEPQPNVTFHIRGSHVLPPTGSLRDIMKAMLSPQPSQWTKANEGRFFNYDWTEECQGVTHDGAYWYLSSNYEGRQRVYRFSLANDVVSHVKLAGNGSNHLGDIDYSDGSICSAMEGRAAIEKDGSWNVAEEIEGITIWEGISYEGVTTHVHVVTLDNDRPDGDDVYFKHYRVPLAEHL